jgi:hypothetical protein
VGVVMLGVRRIERGTAGGNTTVNPVTRTGTACRGTHGVWSLFPRCDDKAAVIGIRRGQQRTNDEQHVKTIVSLSILDQSIRCGVTSYYNA